MQGIPVPVNKVDRRGRIIEQYPTIKDAAEKNFMHINSIRNRCDGLIMREYDENGHTYRWAGKENSR